METSSHQNEPVGFAGLTALVSKVVEPPPPATSKHTDTQAPIFDAASQSPSTPPPTPPTAGKANGGGAGVWILSIIGLLALIAIASHPSTPQYTRSQMQSEQTVPARPTVADATPPAAPTHALSSLPEIFEEKPDPGSAYIERSLHRNQIYYCLLESERIDILKNYTSAASEVQIDYFNGRVNDYNSRCGSYKYYPQEMDAAKRQFDAKIASVRAQFTASLAPPINPAPRSTEPSPSAAYTPPPMDILQLNPSPASVATAPEMRIEEVAPPYGQGHQHSREQLYYCYAESVRLEWAKKTIDMTSQAQVHSLNGKLNDFTSRCTKFHSNAGDRDAVKKQLAASRAALKKEGVAMAKSWR